VRAAVPQENHMRAVCWSPDGSMVAVGFGGRSGHGRSRKDGAFVLLKAADLSAIHEGQDSRDWISEIKFSPDSTLLAMASQVRAALQCGAGCRRRPRSCAVLLLPCVLLVSAGVIAISARVLQDSKVYVYLLAYRKETGAVDIKLACKCEMSNAPVRQLDFDRSSKFLQVSARVAHTHATLVKWLCTHRDVKRS
jgi:hypothetical protein